MARGAVVNQFKCTNKIILVHKPSTNVKNRKTVRTLTVEKQDHKYIDITRSWIVLLERPRDSKTLMVGYLIESGMTQTNESYDEVSNMRPAQSKEGRNCFNAKTRHCPRRSSALT